MSLVNHDVQTKLLHDILEAQKLDEKGQFLDAVRNYIVCLKSLSDRLLIESYSAGLQISETSLENVKLCIMLSERIQDIFIKTGKKETSCRMQCDQYSSGVSTYIDEALKLNQNLIKAHEERINRFFVGNKQHSLNMNLMLQRKMSENIAIAERHRVNLEKKRDEKMRQIIEETERKFRSQECLTEFEIYQKKVYSDVLKFEMIDNSLEGLRETNKESFDEDFISDLVGQILKSKSHPLKTYLQGEQFKICFKLKEILDKAKCAPHDTNPTEFRDEALSHVKRTFTEVVKMFVFVYEQLDNTNKLLVLNKCLEPHFFGSIWDFLKDLFRLSLGKAENHLLSLMDFCKSTKFNPLCVGVPEKFQLVLELNPYEEVIKNLSSVVKHQPLSSKLNCLTEAFHSICHCVKKYSSVNKLELPELGADELLPILSFCLLASNTPSLLLECHILMDLLDDSQLLGENGYCLASVLTALDYLSKLTADIKNSNLSLSVLDS